ncbi:MAG: response regulator [Candidatus Latescibacteria bacterium]|jgi:DNA-binding NtrC family response regulator|nr:response regulator [Candidatus Latescibacterota bacterium]
MGSGKVLLVDDEEEFVEALGMRLEARGFSVDVAHTGDAALEKAHEKAFDAIVLDLAMPGMDGIETLKRLRELNPDSQVILLTGWATVQKATEAMRHGALDLLEKPVEIEVLVERINEATTNKIRLDEKRIGDEVSDILRKKGW